MKLDDAPQGPGVTSVELYWLDLDASASGLAALERSLSTEEVARADRFYTTLLRDRFIAGRGWLRRLLGVRLGVAPESVAIEYGAHGKPHLADRHPRVEFSVSHCGPTAVIALSTVALGVDVERVRTVARVHAVAAHVFSADELRALAEATDKSVAFLKGWTRKEAVLKARGTGFSTDARAITVSLDEPVTLRIGSGAADAGAAWTILDISRRDHVAALAVQARRVSLVVGEGPPDM